MKIARESRKRHPWHCLHGYCKHDCFSGDCQSIFNKTSAGDRCEIVQVLVGLPVFCRIIQVGTAR